MSNIENDTTYHIYAKDRCLYYNLKKKEFEEKWDLLNKMVGLMQTDNSHDDLSYVKLEPDHALEGMSKVIMMEPAGSDSYCHFINKLIKLN